MYNIFNTMYINTHYMSCFKEKMDTVKVLGH